jgi:hypothetical protein
MIDNTSHPTKPSDWNELTKPTVVDAVFAELGSQEDWIVRKLRGWISAEQLRLVYYRDLAKAKHETFALAMACEDAVKAYESALDAYLRLVKR